MSLRPPHLKAGDTIGLLSPSSSIALFPRRFARAISALEKLGFGIVCPDSVTAFLRYSAGSVTQRLKTLHDLFENPNIQAILCTTGGWTANTLLPSIDYSLIARNPKIVCGFSDVTALNLAIHSKTGLITFNGPTLLPSFGGTPDPPIETIESFVKTLTSPLPIGPLPTFSHFSTEYLAWEQEDVRPKTKESTSPWQALREGDAQGPSVVANLSTLTTLAGTEYFPEMSGRILFLEHSNDSVASAERYLAHLEMLGVFESLAGIVLARPVMTNSDRHNFNELATEYACRYPIPFIADVDFGHTEPQLTLPIGVEVSIVAEDGGSRIEFLEPATS